MVCKKDNNHKNKPKPNQTIGVPLYKHAFFREKLTLKSLQIQTIVSQKTESPPVCTPIYIIY